LMRYLKFVRAENGFQIKCAGIIGIIHGSLV
jgi:hypothetical protein